MIAAFLDHIPVWLAILGPLASLAVAIAGSYVIWDNHRKSKLLPLCRRALQDCIAFHRLEDSLCTRLAELIGGEMTPLAIKRFYRAKQRAYGVATPSEEATPKRLEEELAEL